MPNLVLTIPVKAERNPPFLSLKPDFSTSLNEAFLHYTELKHKSQHHKCKGCDPSAPLLFLVAVQARYRVHFPLSVSVTLQLILMAIMRAHQKMSTAHISNRSGFSALLALPSAQLFRHSDISQSTD